MRNKGMQVQIRVSLIILIMTAQNGLAKKRYFLLPGGDSQKILDAKEWPENGSTFRQFVSA